MCCEQKLTDDFQLKELQSPNHISRSDSSRIRMRNGGRSIGGQMSKGSGQFKKPVQETDDIYEKSDGKKHLSNGDAKGMASIDDSPWPPNPCVSGELNPSVANNNEVN